LRISSIWARSGPFAEAAGCAETPAAWAKSAARANREATKTEARGDLGQVGENIERC